MFSINISKVELNGELTLFLRGRLDGLSAPGLESALNEIPPYVHVLNLDFTDVEYISSEGLYIVLKLHKYMLSQNGCARILNPNAHVREIFSFPGFDTLINVELKPEGDSEK